MFGLMKNLMKEAAAAPEEKVTLAELYTGCVIGFGFMPQKNISGKRVPIEEVNSYLFDTDNFISCRLEQDSALINLIVANDDDGAGSYLAISQRIEPRLFGTLFGEQGPETWFELEDGEELDVNTEVLGPLAGWLTHEYALAVTTRGRFFEGDYRLRKQQDRTRLSRPFDYVLLVDEDNEYALEAEKYEDGTLSVFATVYRPATDIGEIVRAPKSGSAPSLSTTLEIQPIAMPMSFSVDKIAHEPPIEASKEASGTDAMKPAEPEARKAEKSITLVVPEPVQSFSVEKVKDETEVKLVLEQKVPAESSAVPEVDASVAKASERSEAADPVTPGTSKAAIVEVAVPESLHEEIRHEEEKPGTAFVPLPTLEEIAAKVTANEADEEVAEKEIVPKEPAKAPKPEPDKKPEAKEDIAQPAEDPALKEPARDITKTKDEETALASPGAVEAVPARSKFGRIQHTGTASAEATLACDLSLAGKLIGEAQRNQMALSELIRKVIDLPARVNEQVLIPFELDSNERAELARRYNLAAGDRDAVNQQIIEELKRFVGDKT